MLQEFVQQTKNMINDGISGIHTAFPAKIVSVNTAKGTATVLPSMKKSMKDGTSMEYPQISGVPIVIPQGAGQDAVIAYPIKAGDSCLIIVAEQSLESWLYDMETDASLKFDISNAICIPGMFKAPPGEFAEACSSGSIIIAAKGTKMEIGADDVGGIKVKGNLKVEGDLEVAGTEVDGTGSYT